MMISKLKLIGMSALGYAALTFVLHGQSASVRLDGAPEDAPSLVKQIDWPEFLSRHDVIWEDRLPGRWHDALLLGNGLLGSMIWQDGGDSMRWLVTRTDVTDHRGMPTRGERDVAWMRPRLPIGYFNLKTVGSIESNSSDARIDLWNAEATGTIQTTEGAIEWRSFVHTEDLFIVVEWRATGGEEGATWEWTQYESTSPASKQFIPEDYEPNPPAERIQLGEVEASVQSMLAGGEYTTAWREEAASDGWKRLFISVGNTWEGDSARYDAAASVNDAATADFDQLVSRHRTWWHNWYPRNFLSMTDARAETYYWLTTYILSSSTREDRPVMELQGPWQEVPRFPWPAMWWNRNTQENYYPLPMANRVPLSMGYVHLFNNNVENIALNAGGYSEDSGGINRVSSYNLRSDVTNEPGNFPRALYEYWRVYRHTMDDELLRDGLFPLLKRAVNYYRHAVIREKDGELHLGPTICPEYGGTTNCNYDLALLRWSCQSLLWANERLGLDDPLAAEWQDILDRLVPYPVDEHGFRLGTDKTFTWIQNGGEYRRQYSPLIAYYPLQIVNWDQPENQDLIDRTLEWYLAGYYERGWRGLNQSSTAVVPAFYALRNQPDKGYPFLERYMTHITQPNGLGKERSPLSGAQSIAMQSMHEFLIQCRNGQVHIFTAVPSAWPDIAMHNMRTEGAFLVDAVRENGQVKYIRITSEAGEPCIVRTGINGPVAAFGAELEEVAESTYRVHLGKGESAILYNANNPPSDLKLKPVDEQVNETNWWGSKARAFEESQ